MVEPFSGSWWNKAKPNQMAISRETTSLVQRECVSDLTCQPHVCLPNNLPVLSQLSSDLPNPRSGNWFHKMCKPNKLNMEKKTTLSAIFKLSWLETTLNCLASDNRNTKNIVKFHRHNPASFILQYMYTRD